MDQQPSSSPPTEPDSEVPATGAVESSDGASAPRGRAARLQAEDAADNAARTQRWRGFGDLPGTEPAIEDPSPSHAAPQASETSAQQPPRRGKLIAAVVVIAVVGALAYGTFNRRTPPAPQTAAPMPTAPVAAIPAVQIPENRMPATEAVPARKDPVDTAPATAAVVTTEPAATSTQAQALVALTARVATLETAIGNTAKLSELAKRLEALEGKSADAATVLAVSERVNALEHTARTAAVEQTNRMALVLAVAQWREAVATGRPFALELESVKAVGGRAGQAIAVEDPRILAHTATGIATTADLRERFDETAGKILRASVLPNGVSNWMARTVDRLLSIVTIRRVDGLIDGDTPAAIVARAGAHLRNANLLAAVTELEALKGPPAEAAQLWLDEARARVATEQAINDATVKAIAGLGSVSAAPPAVAPTSQPAKAEPAP
jgi:uroporphyrinogen-III synthase